MAVVLITGASSGIGEVCARVLHARGYRVLGASRRIHEVELPAGIERVPLDVDGDSSVAAAVAAVVERAERVIERDELQGPAPGRIAHLVHRIINTRSPRLRYTVRPASERLSPLAKAILPERFFGRLLMRQYGVG